MATSENKFSHGRLPKIYEPQGPNYLTIPLHQFTLSALLHIGIRGVHVCVSVHACVRLVWSQTISLIQYCLILTNSNQSPVFMAGKCSIGLTPWKMHMELQHKSKSSAYKA